VQLRVVGGFPAVGTRQPGQWPRDTEAQEWDLGNPLLGRDWFRHNVLKRLTSCCCEL
jgi:hypothetical protein